MKNRLSRTLISVLLMFSLVANAVWAGDLSTAYGNNPESIIFETEPDSESDFQDSYQYDNPLIIVAPPPEIPSKRSKTLIPKNRSRAVKPVAVKTPEASSKPAKAPKAPVKLVIPAKIAPSPEPILMLDQTEKPISVAKPTPASVKTILAEPETPVEPFIPLRQRIEKIVGHQINEDKAPVQIAKEELRQHETPVDQPSTMPLPATMSAELPVLVPIAVPKTEPAIELEPGVESEVSQVTASATPAPAVPYVPLKERIEKIVGHQINEDKAPVQIVKEELVQPEVTTVEQLPAEPLPATMSAKIPVVIARPVLVSEPVIPAIAVPSSLRQRVEKIVGHPINEDKAPVPVILTEEKFTEVKAPVSATITEAATPTIDTTSEQPIINNTTGDVAKVPVTEKDTTALQPKELEKSKQPVLEVSASTQSQSKDDDLPTGIFGVHSFESGLRVESNSMLEGTPVEAGQTLTLSYQITNLSTKERNLVEEFNMPPGFSLAFPAAEFTLAPMETYNSLIMITIPKAMPAGENKIEYNVFDRDDQTVRGNLSFSFAIKSVTALKFFIDEQPENVIGNESFTVVGRIVNTGNASVSARLKTVDGETFKGKVTPSIVNIGAGQAMTVKIDVSPERGSLSQSVSFRLQADNLGRGPRELINQPIYVTTRPLSTGRMDFTRRLPAYLTFNHFGNTDISGSQWQFSAKGALDASKQRNIDFLWRAKNEVENYSAYSQREQFSLTYQQKRNTFRLGEHSFSLSNLTGSVGSAEGLMADFNAGSPTTFGIMSYKSKYARPEIDGSAFYVAQTLSDRTYLRLNHRVMTNAKKTGNPDESLTSLEVKMTTDGNSSIQAEFGHSKNGGVKGEKDQAYNINFSTRLPNDIGVQLSRTDVGAEYGGGLSGAETNRTAINVPISKDISANYNYSTYEQKPSASTNPSSISEDSRSEFGLRYRMSRTRDLSLAYDETDRLDKLNSSFSSLSRTVRATVNETLGRIRFGYSFDRSNTLNRLFNVANWSTGHLLNASFNAGKVYINAYGGVTTSGSDLPISGNDSNNLGFSANWEIIKNLLFRFNYRENFYYSSKNRSSGDLSLAYKFPDTSTLEFTLRNNTSWLAEEGATDYRLTYARFLGVPVGNDLSLGGLRGVVFDALASDSTPLPNITLLIQRFAAITDGQGRFMFANLRPGSYTIDIDRRSVGMNKIGAMQLPIELVVEGGKITRYDIGLVEGAKLSGQVSVKQPTSKEQQKSTGAEVTLIGVVPGQEVTRETMPNLIIELTAGTTVQRRVTDADGRYSFSGLQPGSWSYKLYDANLPEGYRIDDPEGTVELKANTDTEQSFTVSPRVRKILIIDEG